MWRNRLKDSYSIVKNLLDTDKGRNLNEAEGRKKYLFEVAMKANKLEIKKAIEEIYKVKVEDVNTMVVRGKKKRVRQQEGLTPNWKKAIVSLAKDNKIESVT